jgi:hypothetical protein
MTVPMFQQGAGERSGLKWGNQGTHTSRTIMLQELTALLEAVPSDSNADVYISAIIDENALSKDTSANRKLTAQRLSELYALDPNVPLFRALRRYWAEDANGRPLLAMLCALARDPLLRATIPPVTDLVVGEELSRQKITDAVRSAVHDRLNDATLDKVVRNASSSWAQSGHLQGRVRKFRQIIRPTPLSAAYSLLLGYLQGLRGGRLFETLWSQVLDASPVELRSLASEAKRLGALDLKIAGDVVEVGFSTVLTPQEIKDSRVTH